MTEGPFHFGAALLFTFRGGKLRPDFFGLRAS